MIDFSGLYQSHAADVQRFALYLSGDRALAEDLTAETFVRLWGARDRVELATVRGYLFAIVRNLYLQHLRRHRRAAEPEADLADPRPGPAERALARDELEATLAALQRLQEIDRAALLMRASDELPYEEIAAALGITATAARVKVHRARLALARARAADTMPRPLQEKTR